MRKISLIDIEKSTNGRVIGDRSEDIYIDSVSSNSREISENALFVAIPGERVNGHKFVKGAFESGASVALISEEDAAVGIPEGKACVLVDNTVDALLKLAGWYRDGYDVPIVAVTGSVGKTTTKEMIAAALGAGLRVLKTKGNMNSQLGVALMMFELSDDIDIAVIEMGISEHGEMIKLTSTAKPEAAAVTNIGVSHIGNLGSRENIRHEKLDVIKGFPEGDNLLLVPGNDEYLDSYEKLDNEGISKVKNIIWYGETDRCRYRARNIHNESDHVVFDMYVDDSFVTDVHLSVMGIHNVYNALAALAAADHYNVDLKAAAAGLSEYKPMAMRGQIFVNNGITIIDDTYNASPDSMKSGLSVLWDKECEGRRVAALADVLELGEMSQELHRSVGRYLAEQTASGHKTDLLVTVGHEAAYIADELLSRIGSGDMAVESFDSREEAYEYLKAYLKPGDIIMVKGSRGMQMDKLVGMLKE